MLATGNVRLVSSASERYPIHRSVTATFPELAHERCDRSVSQP